MSIVSQLLHNARYVTALTSGSFIRPHGQDDIDMYEYQCLIASLHKEWDRLESQVSASVMPEHHLMDAILVETHHGIQVEMFMTDLEPYSMFEFSLRAFTRRAVDDVSGAHAPHSTFEHAPLGEGYRGLGIPQTISCRIFVHLSMSSLPQLGQQVRGAVRTACHENLGVFPIINTRIEDLHDDD